ncbi:MAG: sugar phosphate isomerase/epimerase [Balneolaceae bacterium]
MKKLFTLTLVLFVFILPENTATAQESGDPLYTTELGVQMYTFRNVIPDLGFEATLDEIQKMGIRYIEGGGARGISTDEFKQMLADRDLQLISTGTSFGQLRENPEEVAEKAKELGAKYVMNAWIDHENGSFNFLNASEAVEVFNKAGKVLAEHGLTFMYHVHGYEFVPYRGGTLLDYMMENTNPEYVSYQMDVLWTHFGGGNPAHLLKKYGDRWISLHLKDLKKGTLKDHTGLTDGDNDVILGTGEIDIHGILVEANRLGIEYMFIEDESSDPLYQVPESIKYLKSLKY